MFRAALPAITAIAYLFVAATPCPPSAELRAAASHGAHDHAAASAESASLTAPCPCGCDPGAASFGVAKRAEAAVLIAPSPPPLEPAHSFAREGVERLPDAPTSVDSPVPIAA
jgi:hypothetical protein